MTYEGQRRVAVVGCGYWGVNHVRILTEILGAEAVVACDADVDRLDAMAERFPGIGTISSIEELAQDDAVDAAVIATPATLHLETAMPLIDAGKHLLVEKPITVTSDDAVEVISAADAAGITLAVGHTFLFNPGVAAVKQRVASGGAGQLHYLYARRCNLGPIRHDVNAMWDLVPHDVSIFNHLVDGAATSVSAVGSRLLGNEREDVGFVTIRYDNGVIANIHASWADPFKVREFVVVGSEERLCFDDTDPDRPVTVVKRGVRGPAPQESEPYVVHDGDPDPIDVAASEPLKNQTLHFLDCLRTGERPSSDGETGLRVVEVMEAIDESIALGGTPVEVERHMTEGRIPA
jgi:predicted dehydrogenase